MSSVQTYPAITGTIPPGTINEMTEILFVAGMAFVEAARHEQAVDRIVAERDSLQREVERLRPIVAHIGGLHVFDTEGYAKVHRAVAAHAREALTEPGGTTAPD